MTGGRTTRTRRLAGIAWLALLALSLALHLWQLGERSLHHDESIHAKLSWDLARTGSYHYDPTYHGPLLYYLTGLVFLVHDSDFTARLPIALSAVALLWVAWRLRRPFGGAAAWWTGLLFTLSPMYLFFGRFLRQDLLELLLASAALLSFYRLFRRAPDRVWPAAAPATGPSWWGWAALGFWTALAFAATEVAYVTVALLGFTALVLGVVRGLGTTVPQVVGWLGRHGEGVGLALAVFVLVTVPLYTVGFTRPGDWCFPLPAITYWWGQHRLERVGGPWWFHLPRLLQYEFLVLVAATVWVARRWRRLRPVEEVLYLFGVASIGLYCHLGEKVPWLGVHQVWGFFPLAGAQLARTFGRHGSWWSRSLAVLGLALTAVTSGVASFRLEEITPAQRRVESLHFVQTCPELKSVVQEGMALTGTASPVAAVNGEGSWPLTWYWRHLPVLWTSPTPGSRPPLVVCDPGTEPDLIRLLGPGYRAERIPMRAWWLMERWRPDILSLAGWVHEGAPLDRLPATRPWAVGRYLLTRLPWSEIGSTDVIVLRETGETEATAAREAPVPEVLRRELGMTSARVIGEGWLSEPRGVTCSADAIAVADPGLSLVRIFYRDGSLRAPLAEGLLQPEAVAWEADGSLVVADTWNHRLLVEELTSGTVSVLAGPADRWYGPRAVAAAPDGRLAVSDTGNKRVVLYGSALDAPQLLDAAAAGGLVEPGGLTFLDAGSLLVCDTGNRRLLVLTTDGRVETQVALPGAWTEFYARPQAAALSPTTWLVSDTPGKALWLVRGGRPLRLDLAEAGLTPTGLAWHAATHTLVVADLGGAIWVLEQGSGEVGS